MPIQQKPNSTAINDLKTSLAVGAAALLASYYLIPEEVIYTKDELAEHKVLTEKERMKRKLFIAYVIWQGVYRIPTNIMRIAETFSSPHAKAHCLAAATMLSGVPGFALMVKAALKAQNGEELTAKREDYFSKDETQLIGLTSIGGSTARGYIKATNPALINM